MKVVDAIAQAVVAEGAELAFNVPDEVTVFLAHALQDAGLRIVRPRHEQNAVVMADGYSRATGEPAICLIGAGPAIAQTGTGFVTAARRGSPVLVLLSQPRTPGDVKQFDARRYVESVGGRYVEMRGPATLAEDLREGYRLVRLRQGPVVLEVPSLRFLQADVEEPWTYRPSTRITDALPEADPSADLIDAAARALLSASRPVIFAGRGAVAAGARDELQDLADRTGSLLATSLQGRQLFRGHPLEIGVIGGFAAPGALDLLAVADCILAVGVAMNPYQMGHVALATDVRVIQIDRDPRRIGQFTPVELGIVSDARLAARALNRSVDAVGGSPSSRWRSENVRERLNGARTLAEPAVPDTSDALPITQAVPLLESVLPEDRIVVMDGGLFMYFAVDGISVPDPGSFVWTLDFGSIGLALAMGIGTALARPERGCVVVIGDGGFSMSLQELETAVRERIPLTIVVMNDAAYGAEVRFLQAHDKPTGVATFHDVDFAAIATAFGARGVTARTADDLAELRVAAATDDQPVVVDVKLTEDDDHRYLAFLEVMKGS